MNLTKYDGTIHPEEWVKQTKYALYNNTELFKQFISNRSHFENLAVEYCKSFIHQSINVAEATTFTELINALKSDASYNAFKSSVKRKLQALKFENANDEVGKLRFLNNFKQLCYDSEITEIGEQKKLFLGAFSKKSIQYDYINCNLDKINSMKELFEYFHESIVEECKTIKNGSLVYLKHVATGKYLSSRNINYQTGSRCQVLFAGEKLPDANAIWLLDIYDSYVRTSQTYKSDKLSYGDVIFLTHKATNYNVYACDHRSPTTGHREIGCRNGYHTGFKCTNANRTSYTSYVRTGDKITLKSQNGYILRSHDFTFAIGNETFQEVVCHNERIGGNDEWQIEFF